MTSKNLRNLFLFAVTLLMVCQLGWAQSAAIPPDKTVVAKALAAAQATGQAVPVVPVSAIAAAPRAMARPLVWLGSSLGLPPGPQLTAEPGFCEQQYTGYYLFCPAGLQTAYGVKQIVGGNGGAGITIAIVDADAYSYAEANLAVFNTAMGLPPCTTANSRRLIVLRSASLLSPARARLGSRRTAATVWMRWRLTQCGTGERGETITAAQDDMIAELQLAHAVTR